MAGDPGVEAGARTRCPRCDQEVLQHSMIPVLGAPDADDAATAPRVSYVCRACARTLVAVDVVPAADLPDLAEV